MLHWNVSLASCAPPPNTIRRRGAKQSGRPSRTGGAAVPLCTRRLLFLRRIRDQRYDRQDRRDQRSDQGENIRWRKSRLSFRYRFQVLHAVCASFRSWSAPGFRRIHLTSFPRVYSVPQGLVNPNLFLCTVPRSTDNVSYFQAIGGPLSFWT